MLRALERFGPFTLLTRAEKNRLMEAGRWREVLCLRDDNSATVGNGLVNVRDFYQSARPMPESAVWIEVGYQWEESGGRVSLAGDRE